MTSKPPTQILATIASAVLAFYAIAYAVLLFIAVDIRLFSNASALPLFALAITPVLSFYYIGAIENGTLERGAWVLVGIMALPTVFFGYHFISFASFSLTGSKSSGAGDLLFPVIFMGIPALLAGYLCLTFLRAALRR